MNPHLDQAKSALHRRLYGAPWLRGIGVGVHAGAAVLVVNVAADGHAVRQFIGQHSMGVPIFVREVGVITPLSVGQSVGMIAAPERRCPQCNLPLSDPLSDGYVRSPNNPFQGSVPVEQHGAALSTQQNKSEFHPAFYIMAAASVAGVLIEIARYMREK